jgi:uncharacterized membrane protein YfcA
MKQFSNIFCFLYLIWNIGILVGIFGGKVTFGQGIGDFFYLVILIILLIVFAYYFFLDIKKKKSLPTLIFLFQVIVITLFTLKMTIWRGIEYPWNGSVFFE